MVGPKHNSPDCNPPPICILKRAEEWVAVVAVVRRSFSFILRVAGGEIHGHFRGAISGHQVPDQRWEVLHMNFITDLQTTPAVGFDSILVCTDRLSRYSYLIPTKKSDTSLITARRLFQVVFTVNGPPKRLITDQWRCIFSESGRVHWMCTISCRCCVAKWVYMSGGSSLFGGRVTHAAGLTVLKPAGVLSINDNWTRQAGRICYEYR